MNKIILGVMSVMCCLLNSCHVTMSPVVYRTHCVPTYRHVIIHPHHCHHVHVHRHHRHHHH
jgi:hypothetical protein